MSFFGGKQSKQKDTKQKPKRVENPYESETHLGKVGEEIARVPKDIGREIKDAFTDEFVGALYGMSGSEVAQKRQEKETQEKMGYTPLDLQRLHQAQSNQDMEAISRIQEEMQEKAQKKQEHQSMHKKRKSEEERVQQQLEQEKMQKRKEEEEEEQRKKEEEERQRQEEANAMQDSGKGKEQAAIGKPRKKAQMDYQPNQFETGRKKG